MLKENKAIKIVNDENELAEIVSDLFLDSQKRHQMGKNALAIVKQNKGAINKIMQMVKELKSIQ